MPALGEAARLVDPHLGVLPRGGDGGAQGLHELLDVTLLRAGLAGGADEDVALVLSHDGGPSLALAEESQHVDPHQIVVDGEHHQHAVVGISKLARVVEIFARRLQTQETMTAQIAQTIDSALEPRGSAVMIEAVHQCMPISVLSPIVQLWRIALWPIVQLRPTDKGAPASV